MNCPKCLGKLQKRELNITATSTVSQLQGAGIQYELRLDQCFVCGGVWFDKGELNRYLSENLRIIDSPSLGQKMDKDMDDKHGPCPRCQVKMNKVPAANTKSITTDHCPKCEGIWLDSTEIDRLERANKPGSSILENLFKSFSKNKKS